MTLSQAVPMVRPSMARTIRRFFIWTFSLTVCWLVVGFPVVALVVIGASLVAVSLQAVLPFSAIAVVAGSVLAVNVMLILTGAALLTVWGLHPHQLSGFGWLTSTQTTKATFASCPLTCDRLSPSLPY